MMLLETIIIVALVYALFTSGCVLAGLLLFKYFTSEKMLRRLANNYVNMFNEIDEEIIEINEES